MGFKDAGQAEVLRSVQKDEYVTNKLRLYVAEISQRLLGASKWMKWRQEIAIITDFTYIALTTLSGLQTLGEEYVNIVQVDGTKARVPSFLRRLLMACLHVGAPYAFIRSLHWMELKLPSHPIAQSNPEIAALFLNFIPSLRSLTAFLHRCHLTAFYFRGLFYHIAKRVVGVRYVLIRKWLGDESPHSYFIILGVVTLIQLLISAGMFFRSDLKQKYLRPPKMTEEERREDSISTHPALRCALCLEQRLHSTTTPCGHLFCWKCIVEWVQSKPQCPLCRENVTPSRLVCLQNYDN